MYDFTLSNTTILDFLEGKSTEYPISEMLYVHQHPLIRPNFVSQIEDKLTLLNEYLKSKGLDEGSSFFIKLANIGIKIGSCLPDLNRDNASIMLDGLQELYQLIKKYE